MIVAADKRLINVEEYYKMALAGILGATDRVELIHGEILKMSPVGSRHAAIVKKLASILNDIFKERFVIGIQDPVILGQNNEPEPDISILRFRTDFYVDSHPKAADLVGVIEVAGTSLKYDQGVKIPLYASHGIPFYWIIDLENNRIEVYENPSQSNYLEKRSFQPNQKITLLENHFSVKDILIL